MMAPLNPIAMKFTPLAAESLGARSMACFLETETCRILIDPGVALARARYNRSPHHLEKFCHKKLLDRITCYAHISDVIIITHYHPDHFISNDPEIYKNKILLLKNPNQDIDSEQRSIAFEFLKSIEGQAKEINYVDGRMWQYRDVFFTFSQPVPHEYTKEDSWVIMVSIRHENQVFLFSSDIQGISHPESNNFIRLQRPTLLYLNGPLTYLKGNPKLKRIVEQTQIHLKEIVEYPEIKQIIIDHHLLRDKDWQTHMLPFLSLGKNRSIPIQTAAEYRGDIIYPLESRRSLLYQEEISNDQSL